MFVNTKKLLDQVINGKLLIILNSLLIEERTSFKHLTLEYFR